LLDLLASDLALWRGPQADAADELPVFPDEHGEVWTANGFEKGRQRRFNALLQAAGLASGRPYDLGHSFGSPRSWRTRRSYRPRVDHAGTANPREATWNPRRALEDP
jgi:hypothetical protein